MDITIYHNPSCGTSRNTLALIRNTGAEPQIIEYLQQPPTRETLADLIARAGLSVRESIRQKGTPYLELGLDQAHLSDEALLDHPEPVVRCQGIPGVRRPRPHEAVAVLRPPGRRHGGVV